MMKFKKNKFLLLSVTMGLVAVAPVDSYARTAERINWGWKFHLGDAGAKKVPVYRAADGQLTNAKVASASEGSNDLSYVDLQEGGVVEFRVEVPVAGNYDLNFRAAGKADGMSAEIQVNGRVAAQKLPLPSTGSWNSDWKIAGLKNVQLAAGPNLIRFTENGVDQPVLDQLEVVDSEGGSALAAEAIPAFAKTSFDDSAWRSVDLPHDFQIEQEWATPTETELKGRGHLQRLSGRGFKEMGVGWYRKELVADPAWKGKRVLLEIEGIMLAGEVWLNGKLLGTNEYGYLGMECDLTDHLDFERPNIVAVRADTMVPTSSRWYTGGGLYRDVHLVIKERESIARHGVFVTTPKISDKLAEVSVQVELDQPASGLQVESTILDPNGKVVAAAKQPAGASPVRLTLPVPNPLRWSCETPHLYLARVSLVKDGKPVDETEAEFGIRTVEFTPEKGLLLNGKKVIFKGVNLHHDLGALGAAAYERAIERRMIALKEMGVNGIRTAHNPYSESFLKLADKHGIMILSELFDKWEQDRSVFRKPFSEIYPGAVEEWIKRDRNHPSVVLYSVGNEVTHHQVHNRGSDKDWGVTTYKKLRDCALQFDTTRKFTVGLFPARGSGLGGARDSEAFLKSKPPQMAFVSDVVSYNYLWRMFAIDRKEHPDWIFFQSEANTAELGLNYFGMDLESVVGLAYWGAVSYLGESGGWPSKGWDRSVLDLSLEKRPQFYFIQSYFSDQPMVHIAVHESAAKPVVWNDVKLSFARMTGNWNRTEGKNVNVIAYSNAEEVELFLNGQSLGTQKNDLGNVAQRNRFAWFVAHAPGALKAVARNSGKVVAEHQLETVGEAVALQLVPETASWAADGLDLQHIRVYAVDSKGRKVCTATNRVRFNVEGPARLVAVDNGDLKSNEAYVASERSLLEGHALAILRAGKQSGSVVFRAEAEGLKGATLTLPVLKK